MKATKNFSTTADLFEYELRVLGEEWNNHLLKLTKKSPVDTGKFQILFDRSPDIFAIPRLTSYKIRCLGLFANNELLGYAFATCQKRYLNQQLRDVIYLGNIHTFRKGAGKVLLNLLSKRMERILAEGTSAEFIYAYVAAQNFPAMKLTEQGYFNSDVVGQLSMNTLLLLYPVKQSRGYSVKRADRADIPAIVQLLEEEFQQRLLSPAISRDIFLDYLKRRPNFGIENYFIALKGGRLVGLCSAWDMTVFKKNRVLTYSTGMSMIRQVYNMAAKFSSAASLPAAGEPFRDITIAEYAVKDRNPDILEALLRYIANNYRTRGYHSLIFGSDSKDPLLKATSPFLSRELRSNVILGSLNNSAEKEIYARGLFYADVVQL